MAITLGIAFLGFDRFERWQREQIESRKIELALEALYLAYESKAIRANRSPVTVKGKPDGLRE
jgi:hypothetical protein